MAFLIALALLPLLQIGASYYASFQTAAFALCFVSKERLHLMLQKKVILSLCIGYLMVASGSFYPGSGQGDTLRAGRQALCFVALVAVLGSHIRLTGWAERNFLSLLAIIVVGQFILVVVQSGALSRGIYIGLPKELFISNRETIPSKLDLLYSKLRPSGTFGEPSYLAAICATLTMAISPLWRKSRLGTAMVVVLVLTCYISQSLFGIIVITIAFVSMLLSANKRWLLTLPFIAIVAGGFASEFFLNSAISGRLVAILNGRDVSANERILLPLLFLPGIMLENPFGIPPLAFATMVELPEVSVLPVYFSHNAFFNILINYGFVGIVVLVILFKTAKGIVSRAGLFVLMMQNGDILSLDKATLLALLVVVFNTARYQSDKISRRAASTNPVQYSPSADGNTQHTTMWRES